MKKIMSWDKDREIAQQLPPQAKQSPLVEMKFNLLALKTDSDSERQILKQYALPSSYLTLLFTLLFFTIFLPSSHACEVISILRYVIREMLLSWLRDLNLSSGGSIKAGWNQLCPAWAFPATLHREHSCCPLLPKPCHLHTMYLLTKFLFDVSYIMYS